MSKRQKPGDVSRDLRTKEVGKAPRERGILRSRFLLLIEMCRRRFIFAFHRDHISKL